MSPPPRPCATTSLFCRHCPRCRRRASHFAARSCSWRGVREQCGREKEATYPSNSRPATPRGAVTYLLRPRRSAPSPPVAIAPRRASLDVIVPRLSPRPAGVSPRPSPCSTGCLRIAAVPARAPSSARKPSRGLTGTQRRAPPCPSSPGSCTWCPMPSSTRDKRNLASAAAGRGRLHSDGARGRFSRRDRLHRAAGAGTCHGDAVRRRRRTSRGRQSVPTARQLSTRGVSHKGPDFNLVV